MLYRMVKPGADHFYSAPRNIRTARGQTFYAEYLSKYCIWLEHSFKNSGLLLDIFDRVRNGTQTLDDLDKVLYQRKKFPGVQTDYGVHYSNESCSVLHCLDLWKSRKETDPMQRLHDIKAGYHIASDNDIVVSGLAALPPTQYHSVPADLCVAEGCEVRLITNLNVSAGLINSACGTLVK